MNKIEVKIKGMTCPSCSASVERLIDELVGIKSRYINHVTDSGKIEFDANLISADKIIAKINEGHYKVETKHAIVEQKKSVPQCPVCTKEGNLVPNTVFKSNLKAESFKKINPKKKYYICQDSECNIAYYSEKELFYISELKRELWFKKSSKRKIICYCNSIDRDIIKEAVQKHQMKTWEEITSLYRKKVIEKYEVLNPTGFCCREKFNKLIQKFN